MPHTVVWNILIIIICGLFEVQIYLSILSGSLFCFLFFCFLRQGLSIALEPVLELALIEQDSLDLTEIHLPLPPSSGINGVHHYCSAYLAVLQADLANVFVLYSNLSLSLSLCMYMCVCMFII